VDALAELLLVAPQAYLEAGFALCELSQRVSDRTVSSKGESS
jgi:hypothetical protein